ncbi:MAG TPA: PEGA domain-containing protein, partial [Blastocatellia bacterium]|nr:PEGA domain-containing protein [Blastocatellia bacterium]
MALIKERKSIAPHAYSLIILAILGINGLFTSAAGQDRTGRPSRKHRRAEPKTKSSTPEPMTVILTILSEPAGCQVLLNGEEKGTTNGDGRLEINKLALAVYSVEVRKPGYVSVSRSFQAGTDPPTLQFKLIASLDAEQKTFDGLVSAGQLVGPSSPNALQFVGDLHAKYPDRVEV